MKIGLRNIKTAISVGICLFIYLIIILVAFIFNGSWVKSFKIATQLYTPFFACLATAYSISTTKEKSLAQGKLRLSASIIGGLFGLAVVSIYQLFGLEWPFQHISATGNATTDAPTGIFKGWFVGGDAFTSDNVNLSFLLSFIGPICITALTVIIVILFCNLIHHPECSFIAVLTLTAVMCSLGTNPIIYGPNRILSTVIGILVALGVNMVKLPHYKNKDVKLIFGLDGIYKNNNDAISGFNHYEMDKLIEDGADVTLFTTRAPSKIVSMIDDTRINTPVICMSGAAVYDFKNEKYLYVENIKDDVSIKISEILKNLNVTPFVNVIKDDLHYVYSESLDNDAEKLYFNNRRNEPYISFNLVSSAPNTSVLYYMVIDKTEIIDELEKDLLKEGIADQLVMLKYEAYEQDEQFNGYSYLKIYSKEIESLPYLKEFNTKKIYGFISHKYDYILQENVSYSLSPEFINQELNSSVDEVVKLDKDLFKKAKKIYHSKEYKTK
jgi:hypothetical protein